MELPTQQPLPVSNKKFHGQRLSQKISRLVLRVNLGELEGGIIPAGVLHKVEVLVVDVLGPGSHLRNLSNRQRTIVVLECFAVDNRAFWKDGEPAFLHLVEDVLQGDGCAKTS